MDTELISLSGITAQVAHDDGGKVTPEMIELAKRAVACKGWRWMPGMLSASPSSFYEMHRVISSGLGCTHLTTGRYQAGGVVEQSGPMASSLLPDLTDPATLGCLLALVREVRNADWIYVVCDQMNDPEDGGYLWRVCVPWASDIVAPTEAEALVVALEGK